MVGRRLAPLSRSDNPTSSVDGDGVTPPPESLPVDPFRQLSSWQTLVMRTLVGLTIMIGVLSAAGAVLTSTDLLLAVRDWDASVSQDLSTARRRDLVDVAQWVTKIGDTRYVLGLLAVSAAVVACCRRWRALLFIPLAMLVEILTFLAVNYAVGRPRPSVDKIGPIPGTFSYPSGHVAAIFVCWIGASILLTMFARVRTAQVVASIGALLTAAMGWSRVYLGMHHTVDVVVGLLMGIGALIIATIALNADFHPLARSRVSHAPDGGERPKLSDGSDG